MVADLRVFVCEDDARFRKGIAAVIQASAGLELCGQAGTAAETLEALGRQACDVLLLDLELPDAHGLELLRRVRELPAPPEVLVLTTFADEDLLFEAMRTGASGYLVKSRAAGRLARAIREVAHGGVVLDPNLARRFWNLFQASRVARPSEEAPKLTEREREILAFLSKGLTNPELGRVLGMSRRTVKRELEDLYRKLGVANRVEAVVRATQLGILDL